MSALSRLEDDSFGKSRRKKGDDEDEDEDDDEEYSISTSTSSARKGKKRKRGKKGVTRGDDDEIPYKSYDQIMHESRFDLVPAGVPTYKSIVSAPSKYPARHLCEMCGFLAVYTCTLCKARYCSRRCNAKHQEFRCQKFI